MKRAAKLLTFLDNVVKDKFSSVELSGSLESNLNLHLLKCCLLKIHLQLLCTRQHGFI